MPILGRKTDKSAGCDSTGLPSSYTALPKKFAPCVTSNRKSLTSRSMISNCDPPRTVPAGVYPAQYGPGGTFGAENVPSGNSDTPMARSYGVVQTNGNGESKPT